MNISCLVLLLTISYSLNNCFASSVASVPTSASLTVVMNAGPDTTWSYFNQSAKGKPSQLVPLPNGSNSIADCPLVTYGVGGCRNPLCYDALFIRKLTNGMASLLNVTSNFNNAVGHSLVISPTSVLWI